MPKRLLIGTNNPSKLALMRRFFDPERYECVSPGEIGLCIEPEEDARTAEGNAIRKAVAFHRASGLPVVTQDSGLVLLDLPQDHPDQPGVRVRRPQGHTPLTDDEDMLAYYAALAGRHGGKMLVAWQEAWCVMADELRFASCSEKLEAVEKHAFFMVDQPCSERNPGWPLNSITQTRSTGEYWAAMSVERKLQIRQQEHADSERYYDQIIEWLRMQADRLIE